MLARDNGLNRHAAYDLAKHIQREKGKAVPAYQTLLKWLQFGVPAESEISGPVAAERPEADETGAAFEDPDRAKLYRALLRLYRFRREEDIDAVVDLTVPELAEEN